MDITPEQRSYARLAGIMYLLKFVLEGVGDGITIISRGSSTFAETARWAAESAQNELAEKRRGAITLPPEASVASVEATSPCTWKSGITQWLASSPESP